MSIRVTAGPPRDPVDVPALVRTLTGGRATRAVWRNELGGLTFEVDDGRFVKWSPTGGPDLVREAERLRWASRFTTVPAVRGTARDAGGSAMATRALPGRSAVEDRWLARPALAVRAIGAGLRALHDALPVEECPFRWSAADRVADARARATARGPDALDAATWHPDHRHLDVPGALAAIAHPPPVDRLVVCHGDPCAPNTLLTDDGSWSGHVDLGALGVADRWADLAVATWSLGWNYGPGWDGVLLDAYGVTTDPERTAYYRLLWDLGP